jgi:5-methylcytosine-specific restriction endonuclease McrA
MAANGMSNRIWERTRQKWFKENPPNFEGYYVCYLCEKWVSVKEITLDHVIPRSRRPDLKYEMSNLQPACWDCNYIKGSKVY